MPTMSVRLRSFLDSHAVAYETIHHHPKYTAQEVAADTHTPGREFAKTVILRVDGDCAMAVLPAHHRVDCEKVSQALGGRDVRSAQETPSVLQAPEPSHEWYDKSTTARPCC